MAFSISLTSQSGYFHMFCVVIMAFVKEKANFINIRWPAHKLKSYVKVKDFFSMAGQINYITHASQPQWNPYWHIRKHNIFTT